MKIHLFVIPVLFFFSRTYGQSQYLDSTFNGTGFLKSDYKAESYDETTLIKLSNNTLYATGRVSITDYKFYESGFGVLKHKLTSGLDETFGNSGKAHYYYDSYHQADYTKDFHEFADGSLLYLSGMGLVKTDKNGALDANFGFHGKQEFEPGGNKQYNKLLILPDGKIYVFGQKDDNLYLERYNSDGFLDFSFGNQGTQMFDLGTNEEINDAKLMNNGEILIIGHSQKQINNNTSGNYRHNFIRKISQDGTLNPNFIFDNVTGMYDQVGDFKKILLNDDESFAYIINQVNDCNHRVLKINMQNLTFSNLFYASVGGPFPCDILNPQYSINDIALHKNQIYIAGNEHSGSSTAMWITRYNLDGTIDSSFADQGKFNYFLSPESTNNSLQSIQVDSDGTVYGGGKLDYDFLVFKISKTITLDVNENNSENKILKVYPNPVTDFLFADVKSLNGKEITISVYDLSGKLVKKQMVNANSGSKISINLSGLLAGNYVVKYKSQNFSESVRIIKK
ncbi:T9SS type A sorting domain-containing protein [Epilithonimonas xixisoli]|uniref:Putative delta-60 repeat protein/predicted secreted protein (Por secretion system target) n=1 Tax=Epilithonimonas xixisoli TaxID=1476462 RepID=A0A4R8I6B8_9FLAO|nr:T9SS type A sorting domain-containing protein [Epilithonimonas xixisoli]TDX84507.1 putative delta-60 repeat protein/predicted secreted protein (Por secretion system target) [Epilithonimonas xixisoli]